MIDLILSILSSTGVFLAFKLADKNKANTLSVIILNYLVAVVIGFILQKFSGHPPFEYTIGKMYIAVILGIAFMIMFFVVSISTRVAGLSVTSIAGKISVVIPIIFTMVIEPNDDFTPIKITGFFMAAIAVGLVAYQKQTEDTINVRVLIPITLFLGMGMVDSLVKYAQFQYIKNYDIAIFTTITFFISAVTGFIIFIVQKNNLKSLIQRKSIVHGTLLGVCNYGSIYFFIRALNHSKYTGFLDGSVIFGVNNVGVVLASSALGIFLFRERLSLINYIGIVVSILTIIVLMKA